MFRKLSLVAAALAVAGIALSAFAPAVSAGDPSPEAMLRGRGVLEARGTGLVAVKGHIAEFDATASAGILLVKDIAGDAEVRVSGDGGMVQWNGFDVYFGVEGEAQVSGSNVAVIVVAKEIRLRAAGAGWAFLKGRGMYTVNGNGPFPWSGEGRFALVGEGE